LAALAVLGLFALSVLQLDIAFDRLSEAGQKTSYILGMMFPPRIESPLSILGGALESLQVAVLGTVVGVMLSGVLAVLAARNLTPHPWVHSAIKASAGFVRAVPALVWALVCIVAVGMGPTPGILALGINSIGMLVKVYAESLEEIDRGVLEALRATGAGGYAVIMQGVMPTVAGIVVAWSIFRLEINVRYAAVLGMVGAGGIGFELMRASRMLHYDQVLGVTLVILAMVIGTEAVTQYIRRQLDVPVTVGRRR
jgi:phosphonate transport system permease protein